jgi:L-2-hydroxyglutarate oxidase LhgO
MVALSEADLQSCEAILGGAHRNGFLDVRRLTVTELCALEPNVSPNVRGGLLIPGESITASALLSRTPRKDEFLILDKAAGSLVRHILLPIPTLISKGIRVAPGETIAEAEYRLTGQECCLWAACTDAEGRTAWTNPIFASPRPQRTADLTPPADGAIMEPDL